MDAILDAHKKGQVLGLRGISPNAPVPRLDIDDLLYNNPNGFNLFLLALQELQLQKSSDRMSYFQIAGMQVYKSCTVLKANR